ncbi:hypothetical protein PV797_02520 [Clostridiaceae bacterium M8S5]|nr:hypothetical protein PV797_02520 [Clostridiaceae bacterium M8S5]
MENEALYQNSAPRESLVKAIIGGFIGSIVGALVWAGVALIFDVKVGWLALGIGLLVGTLVNILGKGVSLPYRIVGVVFSLLGCALGNIFIIVGVFSKQFDMSYMEVIKNLSFDDTLYLLKETFDKIDVLFYAFAAYEGFVISGKRR